MNTEKLFGKKNLIIAAAIAAGSSNMSCSLNGG